MSGTKISIVECYDGSNYIHVCKLWTKYKMFRTVTCQYAWKNMQSPCARDRRNIRSYESWPIEEEEDSPEEEEQQEDILEDTNEN